MHCGVKRKHSPLSDASDSLALEEQQQCLLDLSIRKLQYEHVKHGIDPRLLRFVLINNALRALQNHVLHSVTVREEELDSFDSPQADNFIANTFSHGFLTIPATPPTPVKTARVDGNPEGNSQAVSSDSPLLSSCSFPLLGCAEGEEESSDRFSPPLPSPMLQLLSSSQPNETAVSEPASPPITGKRKPNTRPQHEDSPSKKHRPPSLTLPESDTFHITNASVNGGEFLTDDPVPSLSPIDFAKVDVSLYDFDARATLSFSTVADTPRSPPPSSLAISSCSVQGYITSPCPEDSADGSSSSGEIPTESHSPADSINSGGPSSNQSSSPLSLPSDGSDVDPLEEIDRIVSLLMA